MQLIKAKAGTRCEIGFCRNRAKFTIKLDRVGIRSSISVCPDCLNELYRTLGESVIPKSIETVRPKADAAE